MIAVKRIIFETDTKPVEMYLALQGLVVYSWVRFIGPDEIQLAMRDLWGDWVGPWLLSLLAAIGAFRMYAVAIEDLKLRKIAAIVMTFFWGYALSLYWIVGINANVAPFLFSALAANLWTQMRLKGGA